MNKHSETEITIGWTGSRNFGLDLIRASGILFFVIYHAFQLFAPFYPKIWMFGTPAVLTIEFFFVLSGFLIGTILLRYYLKEKPFGKKEIVRFLTRRWLRTLPLYFLVLFLVFVFAWFGRHPVPLNAPWKFFVFLQCWGNKASLFFPESWSLCIEEWFYFSLPFSLWLLRYLFKRILTRDQMLLLFIGFVLVSIFILRTVYLLQLDTQVGNDMRRLTMYRLDAPVYGVFMAWAWYRHRDFLIRNKKVFTGLSVLLLVLSMVLLKLDSALTLCNILYWPFIAIAFCLLLPFFILIRDPQNIVSKLVRHFSNTCYSIYLLHLSIGLFGIVMPLVPIHSVGDALLAATFYLAFVVVASALSFRFIERPIMQWRDRRFPEV
jgi:peptidoglycan/LPS O-acetylase OafA/YrhL